MRAPYTRYPRPILWLVPGGRAVVGGAEADASPAFEVELDSFYISKFPVSNEQFEAFDPGFERSPLSPGDRDPAAGVSWEEAEEYARWWAQVTRKPIRLPTEAEWEYACRGGTPGSPRWFFGDDPADADTYFWNRRNSGDRMPPLDGKKANGFGLFGMLGGVWEWTGSLYRSYPLSKEAADEASTEAPSEVSAGGRRVLRGGSILEDRDEIACSRRRAEAPADRFPDVGFRIVKPLR